MSDCVCPRYRWSAKCPVADHQAKGALQQAVEDAVRDEQTALERLAWCAARLDEEWRAAQASRGRRRRTTLSLRGRDELTELGVRVAAWREAQEATRRASDALTAAMYDDKGKAASVDRPLDDADEARPGGTVPPGTYTAEATYALRADGALVTEVKVDDGPTLRHVQRPTGPCAQCVSPTMPYGTCHACGYRWGSCADAHRRPT